MGVASSLGIISGINYEELVSKLIQVERNPITLLEKRRTGIEQKVGALDALAIKLSTLKSSADILNDESLFNTKSVAIASTGGESTLTATASHHRPHRPAAQPDLCSGPGGGVCGVSCSLREQGALSFLGTALSADRSAQA